MKLTHYLQLFSGLAVIIIAWVLREQAAGQLPIPAVVVTVLTAVKTGLGLFSDSVQSSSAAKRGLAAAGKTMACLCVLGLVGYGASACTPAQTATWTKVEQVVLDGLENGTDLHLLETAVAALVPAGADVDAIINSAIQLLHDEGVIPPNVLPAASARQAEIAGKPLGAHYRASR